MPKKNDTSECFKVTHDGVDVWCRQTPAKKGQPNIKIGTDMGLPHDMQPTFRLKQSPARELLSSAQTYGRCLESSSTSSVYYGSILIDFKLLSLTVFTLR